MVAVCRRVSGKIFSYVGDRLPSVEMFSGIMRAILKVSVKSLFIVTVQAKRQKVALAPSAPFFPMKQCLTRVRYVWCR